MTVALFYRNFKKLHTSFSHVGLGVNAMHTARVLKEHGIRTRVFGIRKPEDVAAHLLEHGPFRFVVIEALWIPTAQLEALLEQFPRTEFLVRCHSQIGFLQIEPRAVVLLREQLRLQEVTTNFRVAANSRRFCHFVEHAYGSACLYAPNLYEIHRVSHRHRNCPHHGPLKIASFGATRLLKLHPTAAAAALLVARSRGQDLEFYVNVNRAEHGGGILETLRAMFAEVPWARIVEVPWTSWPQFRHVVARMDVCIQVSATETFNLVTADAAAEGVPSAVSPAIDWVPDAWKTATDDPQAVADTVDRLLDHRRAAQEGIEALRAYNERGVQAWKASLHTALQD